uniref:Uncharacterized mitochondrial protein AtMg00810-like n=1 Tax=Tanacetum cinerariifolium TaxID=118510 RepID=A0A6L2LSJ2_TANCI|nr:uncharacterized mitochondrial protein AtMg00810-like [Tanacetum cinerariifolium]
MESCDPVGTPMEIKDTLDLDQHGTPVDVTKYRSMIGALMYLTSSRPDIVYAACLCARYQANPNEKHLKEVKRIFHYLWGTVNTGLWYTKDSGFELTRFLDADYAGCKDTFKSTSGGAYFLGEKLVSVEGIYTGTLPLDRVEILGMIGKRSKVRIKKVQTEMELELEQTQQGSSHEVSVTESKFKTPMLDHQDKYMMKAQVHVSKSFTVSDLQPLPRKKLYIKMLKHIFKGRLLASFLDREHEGGDTRSQGGIKDNVSKIKIQDHSMQMISQMNSQEQGSKIQERFI